MAGKNSIPRYPGRKEMHMEARNLKTGIQDMIVNICEEEHVSRKELARMMGYKSATSLDRLATGKAGVRAMKDFISRLGQLSLSLSPRSRILRTSLMTAFEPHNPSSWFHALILDSSSPPGCCCVRSGSSPVPLSLYLSGIDLKEGCLFGNEVRNVCRCFADAYAARGTDFPRVRQYLFSPSGRLSVLNPIDQLLPLVFRNHYRLYIISPAPGEPNTLPLTTNFIALWGTRRDTGEEVRELLLLERPGQFCPVPFPELNGFLETLTTSITGCSLCINNAEGGMDQANYEAYLNFCMELERGHAIYRFKPDIGMETVPYEIQSVAIREALPPEELPNLTLLLGIQKLRYLQSVNSSRPQIHVVTDGMWSFVRTGMLSDHFWGMRPFTVPERLQIITDLVRRSGGPSFQIRFLRDSSRFCRYEVICYETTALCFIQPGTDYRLSSTHSEIILRDPLLCHSFTDFFTQELVPGYTFSLADSLRILKYMQGILRRMLGGEPVPDEAYSFSAVFPEPSPSNPPETSD